MALALTDDRAFILPDGEFISAALKQRVELPGDFFVVIKNTRSM